MVIISSGFHKTHVTTAAGEASDRGLLALAITAAYPTARTRRIAGTLRVADKGRVARLFERGETIPEDKLQALFLPELLDEVGRLLTRLPLLVRLRDHLSVATWRLYGRLAARKLCGASGAKIYLYRAGFGGASVERARRLGMVTLCDHALAHPSLIEELIDNRGRLRERVDGAATTAALSGPRDLGSRVILADIDRADAVLVNSDFVKDTFLAVGWPAERIYVVYLGVDDNFLRGEPIPPREPTSGRLPLLFAGRFERRKGADVLVEALHTLDDEVDWELRLAGPVAPQIRSIHGAFLKDERVRLLGTLRRPEMRSEMLSAPVFVFPSYAEGSARAVFEALACGCYVITTPNSGTIVEDGVHGSVVPPGDAECLASAISAAHRDRRRVAEIGTRNSQLIAGRYRQADYGDALAAVYRDLVGRHEAP